MSNRGILSFVASLPTPLLRLLLTLHFMLRCNSPSNIVSYLQFYLSCSMDLMNPQISYSDTRPKYVNQVCVCGHATIVFVHACVRMSECYSVQIFPWYIFIDPHISIVRKLSKAHLTTWWLLCKAADFVKFCHSSSLGKLWLKLGLLSTTNFHMVNRWHICVTEQIYTKYWRNNLAR